MQKIINNLNKDKRFSLSPRQAALLQRSYVTAGLSCPFRVSALSLYIPGNKIFTFYKSLELFVDSERDSFFPYLSREDCLSLMILQRKIKEYRI